MSTLNYTLQTIGLKAAAALARALPEKSAYELGRSLGVIGYHLAGFRRQVAADNLQRALGDELAPSEVDRITREVFQNIGRTAIEVFRFPSLRREELLAKVDCDNPGMFDEALVEGKGAILLSAHFGNWEMFAAWIAARGYPIDVVVKPQRNQSADEFYNDLRRATGVGIIPTQKASRQIIVSLKNNRLVAILADQYAGNDGVPVKFFGRTTATHRGPAAIALKLGCPIYHGVFVRQPDDRHRAICEGPLQYSPSGDTDQDIMALTQLYTTKLEEYIRRRPEQWLWTHRRWKNVP
jgi:KDO2-lipid IV(A) lauroyltransferase